MAGANHDEMNLTMSIQFGPEICGNPDEALKREWLETNGLGGFASSTIIGLNTRRYHGLLMAATKPPLGRMLLLSKLEETFVTAAGERFELSANRYPGVIHPKGFRYLVQFRLDPFPVFTYRCGGIQIEKRVFMVQGENTVVVEYDLPADGSLELRPLIAFRDFHSTTHENGALDRRVVATPGLATVKPYSDLPVLLFAHNATAVDASDAAWYRNFEFSEEEARGLDFHEDLFNPCVLRFSSVATATVIASTEVHKYADAVELRRLESERRSSIRVAAGGERPAFTEADRPFIETLAIAADQFIVKRGDFKTVIAGYHWFSDWGRDTMISLPGLTLASKRYDVARNILLAFANSIDRGMLPNCFPDAGATPEYNTVDATLWFFEAVRAYTAATGDRDFVIAQMVPKLADIVDWHVRGTRYGIKVDSDGLLHCGEAGVQLTWMDAKIGDWVVTERRGKPVEIQALWYNALRTLAELTGNGGTRYSQMADQARDSFNSSFWNEDTQCLFDVVEGAHRDASIRPNQIFAVSLRHAILVDPQRANAVVDKVRSELLTPMGLRTLAPGDPNYKGRCRGGVRERDSAYHQGTVWPWLMGPFLKAYLKVNGGSSEAHRQARAWLDPLLACMRTNGLGQLPEIADGDAPHEPRGCIAQAWSVAEVLRALVVE
jgi:predicted glycogen debranching enzyme